MIKRDFWCKIRLGRSHGSIVKSILWIILQLNWDVDWIIRHILCWFQYMYLFCPGTERYFFLVNYFPMKTISLSRYPSPFIDSLCLRSTVGKVMRLSRTVDLSVRSRIMLAEDARFYKKKSVKNYDPYANQRYFLGKALPALCFFSHNTVVKWIFGDKKRDKQVNKIFRLPPTAFPVKFMLPITLLNTPLSFKKAESDIKKFLLSCLVHSSIF